MWGVGYGNGGVRVAASLGRLAKRSSGFTMSGGGGPIPNDLEESEYGKF